MQLRCFIGWINRCLFLYLSWDTFPTWSCLEPCSIHFSYFTYSLPHARDSHNSVSWLFAHMLMMELFTILWLLLFIYLFNYYFLNLIKSLGGYAWIIDSNINSSSNWVWVGPRRPQLLIFISIFLSYWGVWESFIVSSPLFSSSLFKSWSKSSYFFIYFI